VDWIRFKYANADDARDYGLCLVLGTTRPEAQPIWDLVAYEYKDDCAVGEFITLESNEDETQAAYTVAYGSGYTESNGTVPLPHNFIEPGHADFALYISGSNNKTSPVAGSDVSIQYDVYVYPVRDAVGCEELTPEYFPDGVQ
jgi:hypothetical protein